MSTSGLLGAAQIRELAARFGIRPTKTWGQNFVVDAGTVRKIVRTARVTAGEPGSTSPAPAEVHHRRARLGGQPAVHLRLSGRPRHDLWTAVCAVGRGGHRRAPAAGETWSSCRASIQLRRSSER